MKFNNPIVSSEMKIRMRTWRTPIGLLLYIGILLIFLLLFASISIDSVNYDSVFDYSTVGTTIYYTLSIVQFFILVLIAPSTTSGAISSEREKQTLDLLLCTQMSPFRIIIGKLISSISWIVIMAVATIPLYSIAFLFGGVTPMSVVVVLLFYIVLSITAGSIGLFYSTIFKKTVTSSIMSYLTIFLIFVLTISIGYVELATYNGPSVNRLDIPIAFYLNPFLAFLAMISISLSGTGGFLSVFSVSSGTNITEIYVFIGLDILFLVLLTIVMLTISIRRINPIKGKKRV